MIVILHLGFPFTFQDIIERYTLNGDRDKNEIRLFAHHGDREGVESCLSQP